MDQPRISRRRALQSAAVALPLFVRPSALGLAGLAPASERITVGLIGCGGHGRGWNLAQMFRHRGCSRSLPSAMLMANTWQKRRKPWINFTGPSWEVTHRNVPPTKTSVN